MLRLHSINQANTIGLSAQAIPLNSEDESLILKVNLNKAPCGFTFNGNIPDAVLVDVGDESITATAVVETTVDGEIFTITFSSKLDVGGNSFYATFYYNSLS